MFYKLVYNPWVFWLLGALITADAWLWTADNPRHFPVAGVHIAIFRATGCFLPRIPHALLYSTPTGWLVLDDAATAPPDSHEVDQLMFIDSGSTIGLLAPVIKKSSMSARNPWEDPARTTQEQAAIKQAVLNWIAVGPYSDWFATENRTSRYLTGQYQQVTLNGWALVHDLVFAPLVLLFVFCFFSGSWAEISFRFRPTRVELLARGLCPRCRYNVGSIMQTTHTCPECGESLKLDLPPRLR